MLIVAEEKPGMDQAIIAALRNTLTAPHNLFLGLGNPDHQLDPLHTFSTIPGVEAVRTSACDHPNMVSRDASLVPGATSEQFIEDKRIEYGEDGPLYLSRVRGISPKEGYNALIKRSAAPWYSGASTPRGARPTGRRFVRSATKQPPLLRELTRLAAEPHGL